MNDNDPNFGNDLYNGFSGNGMNQSSTGYRMGQSMRQISGVDDDDKFEWSSSDGEGDFFGALFVVLMLVGVIALMCWIAPGQSQ